MNRSPAHLSGRFTHQLLPAFVERHPRLKLLLERVDEPLGPQTRDLGVPGSVPAVRKGYSGLVRVAALKEDKNHATV